MTKEMLFIGIIELVVFLIPITTILMKLGAWKKEIEMKLKSLKCSVEKQDSQYTTILSTMNDIKLPIARLETKLEYIEAKQNEKTHRN